MTTGRYDDCEIDSCDFGVVKLAMVLKLVGVVSAVVTIRLRVAFPAW